MVGMYNIIYLYIYVIQLVLNPYLCIAIRIQVKLLHQYTRNIFTGDLIHLQFPSLFASCGRKCEIRHQRIYQDCLSRSQISLVDLIPNCTA